MGFVKYSLSMYSYKICVRNMGQGENQFCSKEKLRVINMSLSATETYCAALAVMNRYQKQY